MSTTFLTGNAAPDGANIQPIGGIIYYRLPTPPGYWLPNSDCVANRLPCESWNTACKNVNCHLLSGSAPDWTPTNCKAPIAIQLCDWKTAACTANPPTTDCLLGKKVMFVPYFPIDVTFRATCPHGWPQIVLSVYGSDSFGRSDMIVGYGAAHLPMAPGRHEIYVRTFRPLASSLFGRFQSWLLGARPEFRDSQFASKGARAPRAHRMHPTPRARGAKPQRADRHPPARVRRARRPCAGEGRDVTRVQSLGCVR